MSTRLNSLVIITQIWWKLKIRLGVDKEGGRCGHYILDGEEVTEPTLTHPEMARNSVTNSPSLRKRGLVVGQTMQAAMERMAQVGLLCACRKSQGSRNAGRMRVAGQIDHTLLLAPCFLFTDHPVVCVPVSPLVDGLEWDRQLGAGIGEGR